MERFELDESETLAALSYDPQTAVLEIEFRNGAIYRYFAVSRRLLHDLASADSPGAFFNRQLRGQHGEQAVQGRQR